MAGHAQGSAVAPVCWRASVFARIGLVLRACGGNRRTAGAHRAAHGDGNVTTYNVGIVTSCRAGASESRRGHVTSCDLKAAGCRRDVILPSHNRTGPASRSIRHMTRMIPAGLGGPRWGRQPGPAIPGPTRIPGPRAHLQQVLVREHRDHGCHVTGRRRRDGGIRAGPRDRRYRHCGTETKPGSVRVSAAQLGASRWSESLQPNLPVVLH